jgi:hypothetical protein
MRNDPKAVRQRWQVDVSFDLTTFSLENTLDEEAVAERIKAFVEGTYYEHAKKLALGFGKTSHVRAREQK